MLGDRIVISKLLLLIIIVGVLFFLYKRKGNDKNDEVMKDDSSQSESTLATQEQNETEQEVPSAKDETISLETEAVIADTANEEKAEPLVEKQQARQQQSTKTTKSEPEVQLDWANANLSKALEQQQSASNAQETYTAVIAAISECYKQRKSQQYLIYGYSLADQFIESFQQYLAYRTENNITTALKGTAFMQLATLAQDNGNFDDAIEICNQAIANKLSDGTVTGFEGRIKRIEKAKEKAAA